MHRLQLLWFLKRLKIIDLLGAIHVVTRWLNVEDLPLIMKYVVTVFVLLSLASCSRQSPQKPQVVCDASSESSNATLCVTAVSLNLGPADQIEGYVPLSDLIIFVLPVTDLEFTTEEGSLGPPFATTEYLRGMEETFSQSYLTDNEGSLAVSIEFGDYIICAVGDSLVEKSRRVSHCEYVTLERDEQPLLLVSHTPWGDFLSFSWSDE